MTSSLLFHFLLYKIYIIFDGFDLSRAIASQLFHLLFFHCYLSQSNIFKYIIRQFKNKQTNKY